MRIFSSFEKQLLTKMIELDKEAGSFNVLGNLLDTFYGESHLPEHCYIKLISETKVDICIRADALNTNNVDLRNVDNDVSKKLLGVIALFEYLEKQKLAYFTGDNDLTTLGTVFANADYTPCDFLDAEIKPLIYKYSRKRIFVSETLKVLVENSFRTDEEIRHDKEMLSIGKQLNFTRFALAMTTISLVISVLVPILITSDINIKNDHIVTKIDGELINKAIKQNLSPVISELKNNQAELKNTSDSIKEAISLDSLNEQETSRVITVKLDNLANSIERITEIQGKLHNKIG